MDWTSIVIAVLTGGSISGIVAAVVYRRENKRMKESEAKTAEMGVKESEADALIKYGGAMEKLLENINRQQESFEKSMAEKDVIIEQQKHLIEQYKLELDEANKKIKGFEHTIRENSRKIEGMQKTIENEIKERKFVEENVCFVSDCELRRQKRGTYKKETA